MSAQTKRAKEGEFGEVVKPVDSVDRAEVKAGTGAEMQVLIGHREGAPHFAMRRFIMQTGGGMPRHTNEVEHEQFVLRGRARVGIGDTIYEVGANDVLYIPARAPHFYEVIEGPFEFLCMVPNQPDKVKILEEGC